MLNAAMSRACIDIPWNAESATGGFHARRVGDPQDSAFQGMYI